MTNTITDPQEQALMQAVVEAGIALNKAWRTSGDKHVITNLEAEAAETLHNSVFALCDYRAKSSSPEPARCEPPVEHRWIDYHWLERGGEKTPWAYVGKNWHRGDEIIAPWKMHERGFKYYSPCLPDTRPSDTEAGQSEPTREAIRYFCALLDIDSEEQIINYTLEALKHFKRPSGVAEQVHTTDTRIQLTDEALDDFADSWWPPITASMLESRRGYLRACLAHFSPTQTITPVEPEITDDSIWQTFCATNPNTMVGWDRIVQFGRKLIKMARP